MLKTWQTLNKYRTCSVQKYVHLLCREIFKLKITIYMLCRVKINMRSTFLFYRLIIDIIL